MKESETMLFAGKIDQEKPQDSERKIFHVFSHLQIPYFILKHKTLYMHIYISSTKKVVSSLSCSLTIVTLCSPVFLPRSPTVCACKMKYSTMSSWCTQTSNRSACLAWADVEMPGTHPRRDAEEGALGISTWEARNLGWKNPCGHAGSTFISEDEWVSAGKRRPKGRD